MYLQSHIQEFFYIINILLKRGRYPNLLHLTSMVIRAPQKASALQCIVVGLSVRLERNGRLKSILQYLLVLHSLNLQQLFILTWSINTTWWFVFWPIFHAWVTMVRKKWLSLYYNAYGCYIHLFILTWSTDTKWWFVSLTYISRFSDQDTKWQ